jgi:hypothetical protein
MDREYCRNAQDRQEIEILKHKHLDCSEMGSELVSVI